MDEPIASFAAPYVVSKQSVAGAYVDGFWVVAGSPTTATIYASIQPSSGRQMLILPEGERTKETVTVWTDVALVVADQATKKKGDRIAYRGKNFEVKASFDWDGTPLSHFQYLAQLVEVD